MSNNNYEVISEARPHTIKKFELIERYVDGWMYKLLGNEKCHKLVFIDCMCNSGEYHDENGNTVFGTAIRVANKLSEASPNYPNKRINIVLNDINKERIDHLKTILPKERENFRIYVSCKDASEVLNTLRPKVSLNNTHTLLVYDPYKADIDWEAVMPFFNNWGEVILNHMVSDALRGIPMAKKTETIERYEKNYQTSFDNLIPYGTDKKAYEKRIEEIIRMMRTKTSRDLYIAAFPFFNRNNSLVYNLIHYTSNQIGFALFKKAAWKTFGGKSSTKNTHGNEDQLFLDTLGTEKLKTIVDEDCYYVNDIAEYLQNIYAGQQDVPFYKIWATLEDHPIFPADGYKLQIEKSLNDNYGATVSRKNGISFKDRR